MQESNSSRTKSTNKNFFIVCCSIYLIIYSVYRAIYIYCIYRAIVSPPCLVCDKNGRVHTRLTTGSWCLPPTECGSSFPVRMR